MLETAVSLAYLFCICTTGIQVLADCMPAYQNVCCRFLTIGEFTQKGLVDIPVNADNMPQRQPILSWSQREKPTL